MANPVPSLVAVVVTYNRLAQLKLTIGRLLAEPCAHVIIVDNCSGDGTREWLDEQTNSKLHVVPMDANCGGAGGFEAGMKLARTAYDPDWIVVMDDDARPAPGALNRFLARGFTDDAVAAAVYYPNGEICEMNRPSVNPFWNARAFVRTLFGGGRMGFHLADTAYDGVDQQIDAASFVGLFVSRRAMDLAGAPDGRLFLYGDDVIYTLGLRRRGGTIAFAPDVRFEHDCSTFNGTSRTYSPLWKVYYNYRNGLMMYRLAAGILFWPALLILLPKWVWNGRRYGADRARYYAYLRVAVRHGLMQQTELSHEKLLRIVLGKTSGEPQ